MPKLRELLTSAGFDDVRTYVQSGNVVLTGDQPPDRLARKCEKLIAASFGLDVAVVARARGQPGAGGERTPLGDVASTPKRYQVSFLDAELDAGTVRKLEEAQAEPERLAVI